MMVKTREKTTPDGGYVHLYTGTGKGKTTAALGLGLRASGHGWRVLMIQFMKGRINYGELTAVKALPNFAIEQFGRPDFVDKDNPDRIDIELAHSGLRRAMDATENNECDLLILDEINVAVGWKLVPLGEVEELLEKARRAKVEVVLTGRYAPPELVAQADLVTEMLSIRHPFDQGISGRQGIEW
jgi:cob(I)alamin adenosyltransferase